MLIERKANEEVLIMEDKNRELMDQIIRTKKKWIWQSIHGNGLL